MDFNQTIDRRNTYSYKWDQVAKLFGSEEVLPLWVADMDFESPPAVKEVLQRRAAEGIYGYSFKPQESTEALIHWFARRHHWQLDPDWISDSPSVVTSLSLAIDLFSEPGSKVILQSPVYYPFYDVIRNNGREIANNPLLERNNRYEMDYDHLEQLMKDGARLLLLCSPHNPGGRVWDREELLKLGELCLRYGVKVVADEIHCDLILPGHRHIPFASLSPELADLTITCIAPTKTFNIPGLQVSAIVTTNKQMKQAIDKRIKTLSLHMTSFFGPLAMQAAYEHGEEWLDNLLLYIQGNVDFAVQYLSQHLPQIKPFRMEGTYLLWIDCRELGLDAKGLKKLMHQEAKVAFNEGSTFGDEGKGFLRINLACPRSILQEALQRFCSAAQKYI